MQCLWSAWLSTATGLSHGGWAPHCSNTSLCDLCAGLCNTFQGQGVDRTCMLFGSLMNVQLEPLLICVCVVEASTAFCWWGLPKDVVKMPARCVGTKDGQPCTLGPDGGKAMVRKEGPLAWPSHFCALDVWLKSSSLLG